MSSPAPENLTFDFIIVGGGTAGCVLANRLTEDRDVRVLLLEAGGEASSIWIRMPLAMGKLFTHPKLNWGYYTEPESKLNNRTIFWPRGKVLGGSSSINGSAYIRGQIQDYDGWQRLGNTGWGWYDLLPYFGKLERRENADGTYDSESGMLSVSYPRYVHPIARAFIQAAVAAGLPQCSDLAGNSPAGVGLMPYSVKRGVRNSAAEAFLRPARHRENLVVQTSAFARRILLQNRKAVGVEYERGGALHKAAARREVVLTAGAIASPQLLMLSGIGPAAHLKQHGVSVAADLPGVGENLHDHVSTSCAYRTAPKDSLNAQLRGLRVLKHALVYFLAKQGPLTNGASQASAFARGLPDAPCPDLQIVFRAMSHVYDKTGRITPDPIPRVTGGVAYVRPKSRGRLSLKSADPHQPPAMNANYLSDPRDEDGLLAGVKWVRRIFETEPLKSMILAEDLPGSDCRTDDDLRDYLHRTGSTFCHPSGTCRMGPDALAVVDERLRVRGVESLRVIDASIMPALPSCGPAPAVFVIAEKGADLIKADWKAGAPSTQSVAVVSAVSP